MHYMGASPGVTGGDNSSLRLDLNKPPELNYFANVDTEFFLCHDVLIFFEAARTAAESTELEPAQGASWPPRAEYAAAGRP